MCVCVIDYSFFITGSFCKCILPDALKTSAIGHGENFEGYESDKRRLKSSFNCLSSISMRQREKEVSISSLFLQSHYKDCCLPHGSWKTLHHSSELLDSVGSKSFGLFFGFGLYVLVIDYTLLVFPPDGCFGFGFFSYPMVFCTIRLIVYSRTFCARHFVTTMHKDVLVYVVRGVWHFLSLQFYSSVQRHLYEWSN